MLNLKKIAITGIPGSGKSSALKIFQKLGATVLDCDQYVHELLNTNKQIIKKVTALLGDQILTNGIIDRKKIADLVFSNETLLKKFQDILYPKIKDWIDKQYEMAKQLHALLFVVEVPLLFEAKWQHEFDITIAISADEALCRKRFFKGHKEFDRRKKFHLSNKEKLCDIVIENNEDEKMLQTKIEKLFTNLITNQKSDYV